MAEQTSRTTKRIATGLAILFAVSLFLVLIDSLTLRVHAQASTGAELAGAEGEALCDGAPGAPACVWRSMKEVARTIGKNIEKPAFSAALIQGLLNITQFVTNRLAYESALYVANGGPGQGSLFYRKSAAEGFSEFGLEVAGEAVAELTDALNETLPLKFDLCLPPPAIAFNIQLGIAQKYKPQKPRCDILEVTSNWQDYISDAYSTISDPKELHSAILSKLSESLQPGRNELSIAAKLNFKIEEEVEEKKILEKEERQSQNLKDVKDKTTGETTTPNKVVEEDFLDKIKKVVTGETTQLKASDFAQFGDAMPGLALTAASTFTNTLLSQMFNKLYKGLFDKSANAPDAFNIEAIAKTGQDPKTFSKLFATTPFALANYNALTEFVVCPPQGIANRGLNNCVMDSNFLAAISRGNSGAPLTVQEAIDEKLINGDWKLISSANLSMNQDPLCYTQAFCYSNLVKLRKARILPIGWELAAVRNVEQPKTLQEIINEFNNCDAFGSIDGSHPFCHLIDPNWVLKYPETQCRASVNGEIRLTSLSAGRQSVCTDAPSCLGENNKGECTDGYGYCVREKNVWRFRGDECPTQYAGCLALKSTTDGQQANVIINTVQFSVCGQQNAGCQWYRTNQAKNTAGTPDPSDDSYTWLLPGETYDTAQREDDTRFTLANGIQPPVSYANQPARYAYEDRMYFTRSAKSCSSSDAGCSEVISASGTALNMARNPSFEDDADNNRIPDGWEIYGGLTANDLEFAPADASNAARGNKSVRLLQTGAGKAVRQFLQVQPNQAYTLSYFGISTSEVSREARGFVTFYDASGNRVSAEGLNTVGCNISADEFAGMVSTPSVGTQWQRHACMFSTPSAARLALIGFVSPDVRYDGIQLEPSETATTFVTGLSGGSNQTKYVKLAPDYLGCTGAATDSPLCASYAQMCQPREVGCSLYTPEDGDPQVPAIASAIDACPTECVGYSTFKQEKTAYEPEKFPLHFIPKQAKACASQYAGCDSFTNLSFASEGGENIETYTRLRACLTPGMVDPSSEQKQSSTFFTWEGSDNAGYQLRSWQLLESNADDNALVDFAHSTVDETHAGKAPCTKWQVSSKDEVVCVEDAPWLEEIRTNRKCDEHADILTNPDCREFFDAEGFAHYREFVNTVTVSNECQPYRKDRSVQQDCSASGGFWDAQVGFCRYFGLASESASCPAAMNGCRAYTGGAGRNAATILNETFETGTTSGYRAYPAQANAALLISNESVATDGHSLRVSATNGQSGVQTLQVYINGQNADVVYDPTSEASKTATCFGNGRRSTPAGCEIDVDANGTTDCIAGPGEHSCGTLVNKLASGKTFTLQFWAKGTGAVSVNFMPGGLLGSPVELSGAWQVYNLGPIDTRSLENFSKDSVLTFTTAGGAHFFIDNIVLKQVEENLTIIKDSWVVPSTCDATPDGVGSPQYYLGCEAYRDQKGNNQTLYQFSSLCSEKVVGCGKFYQTFESESPYTSVYNARCAIVDNVGQPVTVNASTACVISGKTYCTVARGRSYCTFDSKDAMPQTLPREFRNNQSMLVVYGPETVISPADRAVYFVDNGKADCSTSGAGCREVGKPKFSQDLTRVESFESAYFVNDPDEYSDILCDNEALFCEEYASTTQGNYYFKNPQNKMCDYRASVDIKGKTFSGWFRAGTSEPCYWRDVNGNNEFDPGRDSAYVVSGDQMAIWKNGDAQYAGWVGSCPAQYDLCSEFIDIVDTEGGLKKDGTSYHFLNNDRLVASQSSAAGDCNGQVSQKQGCALFNNRSKSDLSFNASATYVLSNHADVLLAKSENALVDPVDCSGNGGVVSVGGQQVDLCSRRCAYAPAVGDALVSNMALAEAFLTYERSCYVNADCPDLKSKNGNTLSGVCSNVNTPARKLKNDSNTILKVARDRSCSAWLACDSSRTSFNERTNKYEPICDSINLCVQGGAIGQSSACTDTDPRAPEILTDQLYAERDVTWNGYELSGFAIPNQLPVELYDQFNINPEKVCVSSETGEYKTTNVNNQAVPISCEQASDCGNGYVCESVAEQRLVYNAGSCDSSRGNGQSCEVGHCAIHGEACSKSADCPGDGNECVVGVCRQEAQANNGTCAANFVYDAAKDVCVINNGNCVKNADGAPTCPANNSCVFSTITAKGACFNNRCLTDIKDSDSNDFADPVTFASALEQSCRGYPEVDSPYPSRIVTEWVTPNTLAFHNNKWREAVSVENEYTKVKGMSSPSSESVNILSQPYSYKPGYDASNVCGKDKNGKPVDCACTYDKVSYGKGARTLFAAANTGAADLPKGLCLGGPYEGTPCQSDTDCTGGTPEKPDAGSCLKKSTQDTMIGWHGYCIEKDSAIPLYASTEPEDRACLTWLPVDQLTGATDLYAKYTNAGYAPQDTYYCAEIERSYDIGTSPYNSFACAETRSGNCEDDIDVEGGTSNVWEDDLPQFSLKCPIGIPNQDYFAIMTGCGNAAPADYCSQGGTNDDDYPYFCVPYNSYRPDGTKCEPPADHPQALINQSWTTKIYLFYKGGEEGFNFQKESYKDCMVKGVTERNIDTYGGSPRSVDSNTDDYRGLYMNYSVYPSCKNVVQVSKANELAQSNRAWTNRVWVSEQNNFRVKTAEDLQSALGYNARTPLTPAGVARQPSDLQSEVVDPGPHRVTMCVSNDLKNYRQAMPNIGSNAQACEATYSIVPETVGNDARAFYQIINTETVAYQEPLSEFCKNGDCSCETASDCNQIADNNPHDNIPPDIFECGTPVCTSGDNVGNACQTAEQCKTAVVCQNDEQCTGENVEPIVKRGDFCVKPDGAGAGDNGVCAFICSIPRWPAQKTCGEGPKSADVCTNDAQCQVNSCIEGFCRLKAPPTLRINTEVNGLTKAKERLLQLFAQSYTLTTFEDGYDDDDNSTIGGFNPSDLGVWQWDVRKEGDGIEQPTPPKVISLGACTGTKCREGRDGAFEVNDQDDGDVFGKGSKQVTVSFFVKADSNQMPVRRIVVDWGDGRGDTPAKWPTDSQSGSTAPDNFYKNHRGLDVSGNPICRATADKFGESPEACSSSYVVFNHNYSCSSGYQATLDSSGRRCETAPDGRLLNSPCTDGKSCFFQPRVHVLDNWGWCTGFCNAGDDGQNGCFGGEGDRNNECRIDVCPSEGSEEECPDQNGKTSNPWINYDGFVVVEPKE